MEHESLSQEFRDEVRKQAREQAAKWAIGGAAGLVAFAAVGWWGFLKPRIIEELGGVPTGAVVAFDGGQYESSSESEDKRGCPPGFVRFTLADGRFIVGASSKLDTENHIQLRKLGGDSSVVLTTAHLAPHSHTGVMDEGGEHVHGGSTGNTLRGVKSGNGVGGDGGNWVSGEDIMTETGSKHTHSFKTHNGDGLLGQAHNNMPPYIGLYFCLKQ